MSAAALAATFDLLARDCADLRDPWWLIGSAAAHLIGLDGAVRDVDLLTSRRDAETLMSRWGLAPFRPAPSSRFRSELFAVHAGAPMPIELMAGLRVRGALLRPRTRVRIDRPSGTLFVPNCAEQVSICRLFGRPKDLVRAARLIELTP
jgi:hypothetical protein